MGVSKSSAISFLCCSLNLICLTVSMFLPYDALDVWQTSNSAAELSFTYLKGLYQPTHTRFGPFAVGAFLACNVHLAHKAPPTPSTLGMILAWTFTVVSIVQLLIPCFPAGDEAPLEAQLIATAGIRTLASAAGALLLYRALVPTEHAWHWKGLAQLLSLPIFGPIATLSFCSYLLHFRVIMELNFHGYLRALILNNGVVAPLIDPSTAEGWILYMVKLFGVTFVISIVLAFMMHHIVEKPCAALYSAVVGGGKKKAL